MTDHPQGDRPEGGSPFANPTPPPPPAEQSGSAAPPPPPPGGQEYRQPYGAPAPGTYGGSTPTPMSQQEEKTWGAAAHGVSLAATVLSGGFLSFVAALVVYLVVKDRGPFVRAHAANALNVQIVASIVFLVSLPLMAVFIGFLTFGVAWIVAVILHVVGLIKANNGEWWTPPLTPSFVR
ncbi:DUF4870 domain-containing protein [Phycicoccus flavus]|uniref:DUF4870 domain-containing protein n=1 Tax=Phycicoccus flavus TaxID=2502783 RepID=A0A8T6R2H1_9MICO|nr:DUF4870 domain-containing protein [Phycicoccus flavus]NHA67844.1 DUF4870 domain-containing protein [Phycicoccus flavus]